ncbi:uncharacterized protein EDB91DRAFT_1035512, partial [Suillus paluster]|uniref:uncharacterized protein n=1 Tax=Suillus paluster TaxID=48578 RepID=UPI001B85FB88
QDFFLPLAIQQYHQLFHLGTSAHCCMLMMLGAQRAMLSSQKLTNSRFGGIHGAVLGLAVQCLGNRNWNKALKSQMDTDIL